LFCIIDLVFELIHFICIYTCTTTVSALSAFTFYERVHRFYIIEQYTIVKQIDCYFFRPLAQSRRL